LQFDFALSNLADVQQNELPTGRDTTDTNAPEASSLCKPFAQNRTGQSTTASQVASANAIVLIRTWLEQNPGAFPCGDEIESLAKLTWPTSKQTIKSLFGQILHNRTSEGFRRISTWPSNDKAQADNDVSPFVAERHVLAQAARWVAEQSRKCRPYSIKAPSTHDTRKIYVCTLGCQRAFAGKYEWKRHEELIYPQEGWVCDLGSSVPVRGILTCAYCDLQDPDMDHIAKEHRKELSAGLCHHKSMGRGRAFVRRDNFVNHFQKVHPGIPYTDHIDQSHFVVNTRFPTRCNFCLDYHFCNWQDRIDHLANHFESGSNASLEQLQAESEVRMAHEYEDIEESNDFHLLHDSNEFSKESQDLGDELSNGKPRNPPSLIPSQSDDTALNTDPLNMITIVDQAHGRGFCHNDRRGAGYQSLVPEGFQAAPTTDHVTPTFPRPVNSFMRPFPKEDLGLFRDRGDRSAPLVIPRRRDKHYIEAWADKDRATSTGAPRRDCDKLPANQLRGNMEGIDAAVAETDKTLAGMLQEGSHSLVLGGRRRTILHQMSQCFTNWTVLPILRISRIIRARLHGTERANTIYGSNTLEIAAHIQQDSQSSVISPDLDESSPEVSKSLIYMQRAVPENSLVGATHQISNHGATGDTLEDRLNDAQIESLNHQFFISREKLDHLITRDTILEELLRIYPNEQSNHGNMADTISAKAQEVFAILVFIGKGNEIDQFLTEEVLDADLPLCFKGSKKLTRDHLQTNSGHVVESSTKWNRRDIQGFYRAQWSFLAPVFKVSEGFKHYEFEDDCILPFSYDDDLAQTKFGGYSTVHMVKIHPAHIDLHQEVRHFLLFFLSSNSCFMLTREGFRATIRCEEVACAGLR
jgi:hypothetical protein